MPLPAAVAAALVLAIGVALTATVASLPHGDRGAGSPMGAPAEVAVEPLSVAVPSTATRTPARIAPVG